MRSKVCKNYSQQHHSTTQISLLIVNRRLKRSDLAHQLLYLLHVQLFRRHGVWLADWGEDSVGFIHDCVDLGDVLQVVQECNANIHKHVVHLQVRVRNTSFVHLGHARLNVRDGLLRSNPTMQ